MKFVCEKTALFILTTLMLVSFIRQKKGTNIMAASAAPNAVLSVWRTLMPPYKKISARPPRTKMETSL